jgi:multicomponent Na+:H+ antiporter subunit C
MPVHDLYTAAGVVIFLVGLLRLLADAHLLRLVLALHVMGSGTFLVLVGTAYRFRDPDPDPVPHAMVLTGIVVTMGVTALAVALVRLFHARTGRVHLGPSSADEAWTPAGERDA